MLTVKQSTTPDLLSENNPAAIINAMKLKDGLGQIDPQCCNMHVDSSSLLLGSTTPTWHIEMPDGGAVHTIKLFVAADVGGGLAC